MIPAIQEFLYDRAVFARAARFGIFLLAELARAGAFGALDSKIWWALIPIQAAALLVKAGDKTPEVVKTLIKEEEAKQP